MGCDFAPHPLRLEPCRNLFEGLVGPPGGDCTRTQSALYCRSGHVSPGVRRCESRYEEILRPRPVVTGGQRRMFERNSAAREILRKAAPGSEVKFFGALQLGQV